MEYSRIIYLTFYKQFIKKGDVIFEGYKKPIIDLGMYEIKDFNIGVIIPGKYFMNAYIEVVFESEHVCTFT